MLLIVLSIVQLLWKTLTCLPDYEDEFLVGKCKGIAIGGWIGGLFELITIGYNGCYNEHHGYFKCQVKYASLNVTTHCINVFYTNSILKYSPFICLCRFHNNSKGKYRDCEFLHAKIQYI